MPFQLHQLLYKLLRESIPKLSVEFFYTPDLFLPLARVYLAEPVKGRLGDIKTAEIKISIVWHEAYRRFLCWHSALNPIHHPFDDAEVFPESRPDEEALDIPFKPVDKEYLRGILEPAAHIHPVAEVVGHIVPAEREHGQGIAAETTSLGGCCGGRRRTQGRRLENAVVPVEALAYKGNGIRPSPSKKDRRDRYPLGVIKLLREDRTVVCRHREAGVGVCSNLSRRRIPGVALPVEEMGRGLTRHHFPTV